MEEKEKDESELRWGHNPHLGWSVIKIHRWTCFLQVREGRKSERETRRMEETRERQRVREDGKKQRREKLMRAG